VTRENAFERQLADWLEEGPLDAPDGPVQAAVAHARAHPRRRLTVSGLWRTAMSQLHLAEVQPRGPQHRGLLAAVAAVAVVGAIVIGLIGTGVISFNSGPEKIPAVAVPVASPEPATPLPTVVSTTAPIATPSTAPTVAPTRVATPVPLASPRVVGSSAYVTGTQACTYAMVPEEQVGDHWADRGLQLTCEVVMNDPRVSGTASCGVSLDYWGNYTQGWAAYTAVQWGSVRLENEGGAWEGTVSGVHFPYYGDAIGGWLEGSGEYEGLSYYLRFRPGESKWWTGGLEGLIFTGSPPPR